MLNARKLSLDDLKKISGGTYEDAEPYLQELYAKYGLDEDRMDELFGLLTDEEYLKLWDLAFKK